MARNEGLLEGIAAGQAMGGGLKLEVKFTLERDDSIPAFGGFLRCAPECECKDNRVLINVQGILSPVLETDDGMVHATKEERKRLLITTIMHEFGHVLEKHFGLPDVEEAIEKACDEWEAAWRRGLEANGEKMPETYEQQLERLLVESYTLNSYLGVWLLSDRTSPVRFLDEGPDFSDLPPNIQERVKTFRKEHYGIE